MTERDDHRVRKALQGAGFPAAKRELLRYADERGTDEKTLEALRGVPDQQFGSLGWPARSEDEEIAEVVSYLRQLGDNDASPVTTGDVEEARDAERFTGEPGAADEDD